MQFRDDVPIDLDLLLEIVDFFEKFADPEIRYAGLRNYCHANRIDYAKALHLAATYSIATKSPPAENGLLAGICNDNNEDTFESSWKSLRR